MEMFLFEFVKWKEMILNDDQICKYLNDKFKEIFKLRHKISMQFHVTDRHSFKEKMINPVE
jgi:hypothetical protein